MNDLQREHEMRTYHINLQQESLHVVVMLVGAICYVWFTWMVWPASHKILNDLVWAGWGTLAGSVLVCRLVKNRYTVPASWLLVIGMLLSITCIILTYRTNEPIYFFVVPIIFSAVLLNRRDSTLLILLTLLLIVSIGYALVLDITTPAFILILLAMASSLSIRNLYTVLAWSLKSYDQAYANEQIARDRQAELARTLKALDIASRNLERANYMLMLARAEADEGRRLKQQFAQNISHELRTPLNLIVGFTEMMVQSPEYYGGSLSPRHTRDLGIVYKNALHLQKLVNDVLDLARIETAQMSLTPETIHPAALVEDAANTVHSLVEVHGLKLALDIAPDLPFLCVDATRIRQVLFNLISNAVRFTKQGGITLSVRGQGDQVIYAVRDTGIGIDEKHLARIFEAFYQIDRTSNRGGAGLGLAISQEFVRLHGGRIWAESQPGAGSTLSFSLPTNHTADTHPMIPGQYVSLQKDRMLLVVTPTPPAASLFSRYLHNCRTVTVQDFEQAGRAARELLPQIVLIDTAYHAAGDLADLGLEWELPQTLFVRAPMPGQQRRKLAANHYLTKPVSRHGLWDTLRRYGDHIDTILIIDDDRDFVRLMTLMLDHPLRRYQVVSAYSGWAGITMLEHYVPDLVLLDLQLPDLHGAEVLDYIRAVPKWRELPVVIVSAAEELDPLDSIPGELVITRSGGFKSGEIIRWVEALLDMVTLKPVYGGEQTS